MTMHQCVVDGVSVYQVLPTELTALYTAFSSGKPSALPELPVQYADFARWERQWLQGANGISVGLLAQTTFGRASVAEVASRSSLGHLFKHSGVPFSRSCLRSSSLTH